MSLVSVINSIKKCAKGCYKNIFLQAMRWDSLTPTNTECYQFPQYFNLTESLVFSQILLGWCCLGWLSWSSSSFPQKSFGQVLGSSEAVEPLWARPLGRAHVVAQLVQIFGHHVEANGHKALGAHPGHWQGSRGMSLVKGRVGMGCGALFVAARTHLPSLLPAPPPWGRWTPGVSPWTSWEEKTPNQGLGAGIDPGHERNISETLKPDCLYWSASIKAKFGLQEKKMQLVSYRFCLIQLVFFFFWARRIFLWERYGWKIPLDHPENHRGLEILNFFKKCRMGIVFSWVLLFLWLSSQNSPRKIQAQIQCSQQVINMY